VSACIVSGIALDPAPFVALIGFLFPTFVCGYDPGWTGADFRVSLLELDEVWKGLYPLEAGLGALDWEWGLFPSRIRVFGIFVTILEGDNGRGAVHVARYVHCSL
jgi:hypothetical protein